MLSLLESLMKNKDLTVQESEHAVSEILDPSTNPFQIAAFLTLMGAKGETVDEITAIIQAMRKLMEPIDLDLPVLDIVGTGGDGLRTINISTASCLLAASCGVRIAKHGSRSASSLCGSADVLEALGIDILQPSEKIIKSISELGMGFMFAPLFHPAAKQLSSLRKQLKIRTFFNLIGPLLNPAKAQYMMVGVYDPKLLDVLATSLQRLGTQRSWVFHGGGCDELTCLGPVTVMEVTPDSIKQFTLDPIDFGLPRCTIEDLKGGDAELNASLIIEALEGKRPAIAHTLVLNAAAALTIYGTVKTLEEGIALAQDHLNRGSALNLLQQWKESCQTI